MHNYADIDKFASHDVMDVSQDCVAVWLLVTHASTRLISAKHASILSRASRIRAMAVLAALATPDHSLGSADSYSAMRPSDRPVQAARIGPKSIARPTS